MSESASAFLAFVPGIQDGGEDSALRIGGTFQDYPEIRVSHALPEYRQEPDRKDIVRGGGQAVRKYAPQKLIGIRAV